MRSIKSKNNLVILMIYFHGNFINYHSVKNLEIVQYFLNTLSWLNNGLPDIAKYHKMIHFIISSQPTTLRCMQFHLAFAILLQKDISLQKSECFASRISSVSVAKSVDLVIFAEQILNGKLHFLCSVLWERISNILC